MTVGQKRSLPLISWQRQDVEGVALFRVSGRLDERFAPNWASERLPQTVVLDLGEVSQLTSSGIARWMTLLETLKSHELYYVRASPAFVAQLNSIPHFAGHGQLVSLLAPWRCEACELEIELPVDLRMDVSWMVRGQLPLTPCPSCYKAMDFDDNPEVYFQFAKRQLAPNMSRAVKALADDTLYVAQPLRVEKEVHQQLTALWVSGSLQHVRSLRRFLDGSEGEVFIHFHHLQHTSNDNLEKLLAILETVPCRLTVSSVPESFFQLRPASQWPINVRQLTQPQGQELAEFLKRPATRAKFESFTSQRTTSVSQVMTRKLWGQWELLECLERGSGLEIFLARQSVEEKTPQVILNRVVNTFTNDIAFQDLLLREVRAVSQLRHDNIAQVLDAGVIDASVYFTYEYIDGISLKKALRLANEKQRPMPLGLAVWVAQQITQALIEAHGHVQGIPLIHRGLEPNCVLLSWKGKVKVTNFGLTHAADQASVTPSQTILGSRMYLAPEQVRLGVGLSDARVDLFPVGLILYECATLERMYARDNEYAMMWAVLNEAPKTLSERLRDVPMEVESVLAKCLQKEVQHRFSSSQKLWEALTSLLPPQSSYFHLPDLKQWLAELKS